MPEGHAIRGAEQLTVLAKKLRAAGDRNLRRELLRGLRAAGKPMGARARANAMRLPHRGGLAQLVASSRITVQTRLTGNVRVRIVARNESAIINADKGKIRHPVHGTDVWVTQKVQPGWWTDAARKTDRPVAREMARAVANISRQLSR